MLTASPTQTLLFDTLDRLETRLKTTRVLMGDRFTLADLWLFPTISRFDAVYAGIFRSDVTGEWKLEMSESVTPASALLSDAPDTL